MRYYKRCFRHIVYTKAKILQTEIDIKDFEKKVVKTFCDECFSDAFGFIEIDNSKVENVSTIANLVELLVNSKVEREFYLYEGWIENSFCGFEKIIENHLLSFPPEERQKYPSNVEFEKSKRWLYEVFYAQHTELLEKHTEVVELNEITGACDFEPDIMMDGSIDQYGIDEHAMLTRNAIPYVRYKEKLDLLFSKVINDKKILDNRIGKIDDNLKNILSVYFKFKPRPLENAESYLNESDLTIGSKPIPYKEINDFLKMTLDSDGLGSETARRYAEYLYKKGDSKKKEISGGANSLKVGARDRLFRYMYEELIFRYLV